MRLLLLRALGAVPDHHGEPRWARAALPDAEQRTHAELFHVLDVEDFDVDTELLQRFRLFGELDGTKDVGRLIDEIAGEVDAVGNGLERLERCLGLVGMGDVNDELLQPVLVRCSLIGRLLRKIFFEVVVTQQRALRDLGCDLFGAEIAHAVDIDDDAR